MIRNGKDLVTGKWFEEQFVDFEVAKLLQENGFNEHCDHYYDKNGKLYGMYPIFQNSRQSCSKLGYACCNPHFAIRWLKEIAHCNITENTRNMSDKELNMFILKQLKRIKRINCMDAML